MTIWEYISFTKIVSINNYNDWIINQDLTKFHHCMSTDLNILCKANPAVK